MRFDHLHYVPCLRWKLGEYQAVSRLPRDLKQCFTPLIEIPEMGYDFEAGAKSKTIDEHLKPVAKRICEKWGRQLCFIDLDLIQADQRMRKGIHPLRFLSGNLHQRQCSTRFVTGLHRDDAYQEEIKHIMDQSKSGICLRLKVEDVAKGMFKQQLKALLYRLEVEPSDCDIVIDLGTPNFVPIEGFSKAIRAIVYSIPKLNDWRTFTVLGTSFPKSMGGIKNDGEIVFRHEWVLYRSLIASFEAEKLRLPTFGDYAINHPEIPELDWRVVKPAATIRYTVNDAWYIVKGKNVRDERYGKFEQYRGLSKILMDSRHYCGSSYSWGDEYISMCADGSGKTGNLPMWRQVGTNHHITKVIRDIASFYASSDDQ